MSSRHNLQDATGILERDPGRGILQAVGGAPTNSIKGYAKGCLWHDTTNALLYLNTGTNLSSAWKVLDFVIGSGTKIAAGQLTTVTAADTVVTGLATVISAVAVLDADPGDDPMLASCTIGDQAGSPAAGSIIVKTWKNTGGTDPTPLAATTFSKKVNWIAFGT